MIGLRVLEEKMKMAKAYQPELKPAARRAPAPPPSAPQVVQYKTAAGEAWRVEHWALLRAELPGLEEPHLPALHAWLAAPGNDRAWLMVRRTGAVNPVLIPLNSDPADFEAWPRARLRDHLGLTEKQLKEEWAALRLAWEARSPESKAPGPELKAAGDPSPELLEDEDALLRRLDFRPEILRLTQRSSDANKLEKQWFCQRLRDLEPWLTDQRTGTHARTLLGVELRLRRATDDLWDLESSQPPAAETARFDEHERAVNRLRERVNGLQDQFRASEEALQKAAPDFGKSLNEVRATGALGEFVKGIQEFEAAGDRRKIDGIHTALQIQVLLRTSQQVPLPSLRPGLVAYWNEAKRCTWDPHYQSALPERMLAAVTKAFQASYSEQSEALGLPRPDLLKDGEEYPPLEAVKA